MKLQNDLEPFVPPITVLCIIETLGRGGGAEQLVASLAMPLRERGIELEFVDLFSWPDDLGVELQRQGFVVHRLKLSHRWNLAQGFFRLRAIVSARKPKIVWGHLFFGNLYASLLGLCLPRLTSVITLHSTGGAKMTPRSAKGRISLAFEQWLNSRTKYKIAVSFAVRDAYCNRRMWGDIRVIHNGIDIGAIPTRMPIDERKLMRQKFSVSDDEFVIAVPARFVSEKGHLVLIDAISHLASKHALHPIFLLIGEFTPLVKILQAKCRDEKIDESQIRFLTPLPQKDLFAILCCADGVVLPSIEEAFGMAAVEAMAMDLPVILSRVGGMAELDPLSEIVTYVPPGDSHALTDAIASLIQDYEEHAKRGHSGRQLVVDRFSLDRCAVEWQALFVNIFSNSANIHL